MPHLKAVIFDFDGVIAHSEPVHCAIFQRVLGEQGLFLSEDEYYRSYLGYDDRGCFAAAFAARDLPLRSEELNRLVERKAELYFSHIRQHLVIFPGVRECVREAASSYPLAIASGALRREIQFVLEEAGIRKEFQHITSAEDVRRGKPDPESFLHALAGLNRRPEAVMIRPEQCLVIEDSVPGIRGAHRAGMKVVAVANTHSVADLAEADEVTESLATINLSSLAARLFP